MTLVPLYFLPLSFLFQQLENRALTMGIDINTPFFIIHTPFLEKMMNKGSNVILYQNLPLFIYFFIPNLIIDVYFTPSINLEKKCDSITLLQNHKRPSHEKVIRLPLNFWQKKIKK